MRSIGYLFLGLALAGCGGGATAPTGPTRTKADLDKHGEYVHGMQPFDEAKTALVAAYGEPDEVAADMIHWYGKDGETCVRLSVQDMGGIVGTYLVEPAPCPVPAAK